MPLLLILAFLAAAYLISAPDPVTLRATRGTAGAIGSWIRPGGAATRSTPRSGGSSRPRSTRSTRRSDRPTRSDRPASRIGAAIRGGIRSADRAEAKRTDLRAAVEELIDRGRQRRRARRIDRAEQADRDENDRRDRAAKRERIRGGVKQIAEQIDPAPEPAQPEPARARIDQTNGAPVASSIDTTHIPTTELQTLDDLLAEANAVTSLAQQIEEAAKPLVDFLAQFGERIKGATDLPKTPQMEAAFAVIEEIQAGPMEYAAQAVAEKWGWLEAAVKAEQNRLKEIGPATGRLENVAS